MCYKMLVFPFLTLEQQTTFKESMINRLSNLINRNRSAAKISQVLCSSAYPGTEGFSKAISGNDLEIVFYQSY